MFAGITGKQPDKLVKEKKARAVPNSWEEFWKRAIVFHFSFYTRCRPEKDAESSWGAGFGDFVTFVTGHKPRVLMFGPGLDSRTSKLVRSILSDPAPSGTGARFSVTGMVPGEFAGSEKAVVKWPCSRQTDGRSSEDPELLHLAAHRLNFTLDVVTGLSTNPDYSERGLGELTGSSERAFGRTARWTRHTGGDTFGWLEACSQSSREEAAVGFEPLKPEPASPNCRQSADLLIVMDAGGGRCGTCP